MKKISVISGLLLAVALIFAVVLFNHGNAVSNPTLAQIRVDVEGCTDCDVITYCIDGGKPITVYTNPFYAQYDDMGSASHTICVKCCGNKAGTATFTSGDPKVKVIVSSFGADCQCGNTKK